MPSDVAPRHELDRAEERDRFLRLTQHRLIRVIGGGAYGQVWLAQSVTGAYRAIKVVFRRDFKSDTPYEREYRGILKFEPISRDHDGFIDILHVGRDDAAGYFYYVMELGDDPEDGPVVKPESYFPNTLDVQRRLHRRIPFEKTLQFSLKLTLALGAMHHAGLVHRDIKPQNIVFVNGSPKLADIGLVTDAGLDVSFVGTEGYVPREGPGDPSADIYSLGKSLYEIATGNDRMEFPELPEDLLEDPIHGARFSEFNEVLVKACEIEPANRYRSADEMHAHLALIQAGKSVRRLLEFEKWRNRIRRYLPATLVSAAAVVALFILLVREQQRTTKARQEKAANATSFANSAMRSGEFYEALPWLTDAIEADDDDPKRTRDHRLQMGSVLQHTPRLVQRWPHLIEEGYYVTSLQFRPDTEHVLIPDTNGLWAFFDVSTGERIGNYLDTRRMHDAAALSRDGKRAVLCGFRSGLDVWDFDAKRVIFSLSQPKRAIRFATFDPAGGQILLALSVAPFAEVIDLATGKVTTPFEGLAGPSFHFAYNAEGDRLALSSIDGVRIWNTEDWSLVSKLARPKGTSSYQSVFYPKSAYVATCTTVSACVWDSRSSTEILSKLTHNDGVSSIDVSPDGRVIATGSWDRTVRLWDARKGRSIDPLLRHNHRVMYVKFCPKGCHLVSASYEGVVTAWKMSELSPVAPLVDAVFSTDGRRAAWITNGTATIQALDSSKQLGTIQIGPPSVLQPFFSDDGSTFVVSSPSSDGVRTRIWDLSRARFSEIEVTMDQPLTNQILSWNGSALAARTGSQLRVFDTRSGEVRFAFKAAKTNSIHFAAFSHSGRYLAIATNNAVVVADLKSGLALDLHPVTQSHPISWIEYGPDDKYFVTAGASTYMSSSYAQIWTAATGRPVGPPLWQTDGIYCARFSPDGRKLVTTSEDFSAMIWDAQTGIPQNMQRIEHSAQVAFAAFSSDSRWLVTAGRDSVARVWDAATGNPLTLPFVHPAKLRRAHFAAGDTAIVTRSDAAQTWYWKLPIESKPLSDLTIMAKLLSNRQAAYTPPEVYMTNDIFRSALKHLHTRYPEEFGVQ